MELVSNSMETLLTYQPRTRRARSYPIKGTRAHASGGPQRLLSDPKERAEHVMIVDLVRNDLGQVCVPGSVRTPELMGSYAYRGLWHGVSTVEGNLRPELTPGALLGALFPGGSITGAPKRRAMEIIRDLEGEARGAYTGSLGVVFPNGELSVSIMIRTLVRDARGWSLHVGGGIVADSEPARELEETWEKAAVFAEALATAPATHLHEELAL